MSDEKVAWIAGGTFRMGSDDHHPEEAPARSVAVDGFWIDRCQTTNREFAAFVEATGYVTVAERPLDPADFPGTPPEKPSLGLARLHDDTRMLAATKGILARRPRGSGALATSGRPSSAQQSP